LALTFIPLALNPDSPPPFLSPRKALKSHKTLLNLSTVTSKAKKTLFRMKLSVKELSDEEATKYILELDNKTLKMKQEHKLWGRLGM
jgi:phage gp16-like protein